MLSLISLAECQVLGLVKSINNKSLSYSGLARLASGIHELFCQASVISESFQQRKNTGILGGLLPPCLNLNLANYIIINKTIFLSLSYTFIGVDFKNNYELPKAKHYLSSACSLLDELHVSGYEDHYGKEEIDSYSKKKLLFYKIYQLQFARRFLHWHKIFFEMKKNLFQMERWNQKFWLNPLILYYRSLLKLISFKTIIHGVQFSELLIYRSAVVE